MSQVSVKSRKLSTLAHAAASILLLSAASAAASGPAEPESRSAAAPADAAATTQSKEVEKSTAAAAHAAATPPVRGQRVHKSSAAGSTRKQAATAAVDAPRKAALARFPAPKPKPPAHDPKATRVLEIDGLGEVTVYAAKGEEKGIALFASGDGNWNLGVWDMAQAAAELGYWVAGFSTPGFLKSLESGDGECSDAAGLLDHIAERIKTQFKLPATWRPVLIGYSSGATIMYAALAQAGDARFGGAMTLGFCPDLVIHKPFCAGAGLTADKQTRPPYGIVFNTVPVVKAPWIVLQGDIDQVCNPPATEAFVRQVKGGRVVMLPKVGHGYSVPRNWMPQYRQGLLDLLDTSAPARVAGVRP